MDFRTDTFSSYGSTGLKASSVCPTWRAAYDKPLLLPDYIACHKVLMIFFILLLALVSFAFTKTVKKDDNKKEEPKK